MLADGMLSCEVEAPDWYVGGDREDFLNFYESDFPGANRFHRRFAGGFDYSHHFAPSMVDGHLLICYMNKLMCLTPQAPRPRLDIPLYIIDAPVPFGLGDPYTVIFPDPANALGIPGAIGNLGGAPLTLDSVVLSDTSNGLIPDLSGDPGGAPLSIVDPALVDNMEKLASKFASDVDHFRVSISEELGIEDIMQGARSSRNNAAFAIPSWVYTGTLTPTPGTVVPATGDYTDSSSNYVSITVDVNGTQVPRGYTGMYAFVYSDDPDYFLDSALMDAPKALAHAVPCVQLGIIGGCLYEDVVMHFGLNTGDNYAHVWNSTKIADGDITSIEIGGDDGAYWQGSYVFAAEGNFLPPGKPGLFSNKVALHARNWSSADPMSWMSILPDPDCVAGLCPPQHTTNALLGTISDDGTAYRDVWGEIVTFAVIDSVQDCCEYDTLGACTNWNWTYAEPSEVGTQPPYSDIYTMGFKACVTVIGAYDEDRLKDFYIEKFEFNARYGAPVNGVWMGVMNDYDINYNAGHTQQVAAYDADISTAWAYTCNNNSNGWGFVKIPYDCSGDYAPIVNAKTIAAGQGPWNDSMVWLDSAYYWMSALTGATHQTGTDPAICAADPDDRDWFGTIAELDIPAAGDPPLTLATAIFGRPDLTTDADLASSYAQMSITAQKWCGFWRGDVDDDLDMDILDVALIIDFAMGGSVGPYPFMYLGDVDIDGDVDCDDALYLLNYIMQVTPSPAPMGAWTL